MAVSFELPAGARFACPLPDCLFCEESTRLLTSILRRAYQLKKNSRIALRANPAPSEYVPDRKPSL